MTKYTKKPQLIDTIPTMSVSSASSTITVRNLKIGKAKSITKSDEEEKALVLPKIVVVNNEEGWNDISKGNRKAKSSGNGTGAIVTAIYDQKLTTTGHGNIPSKTIPITDPSKMEKKKKKRKRN